MYRSYSFLNSGLGEVNDQRHAPAALYRRERPPEVGWASHLVSAQRLEEKSFACAGDLIPIVQSVV